VDERVSPFSAGQTCYQVPLLIKLEPGTTGTGIINDMRKKQRVSSARADNTASRSRATFWLMDI
jgi:hypothetical protein